MVNAISSLNDDVMFICFLFLVGVSFRVLFFFFVTVLYCIVFCAK